MRKTMSDTKAKAVDSEVLTLALDDIQEQLERHTTMLTHLEARPIVELTGLTRRIDDLADTVDRLRGTLMRRSRPWWVTPGVVTLSLVVGLGSGSAGVLWLQSQRHLESGTAKTAPASVPQAAPKKGK
jgi:uncharacterized protein HemX